MKCTQILLCAHIFWTVTTVRSRRFHFMYSLKFHFVYFILSVQFHFISPIYFTPIQNIVFLQNQLSADCCGSVQNHIQKFRDKLPQKYEIAERPIALGDDHSTVQNSFLVAGKHFGMYDMGPWWPGSRVKVFECLEYSDPHRGCDK